MEMAKCFGIIESVLHDNSYNSEQAFACAG